MTTLDKAGTSILTTGTLVKFGGESTDDLVGFDNKDFLFGGSGSDTLVGRGGDDYLEGGKDTDSLIGGTGNDAYAYSKGDGKDTIDDQGDDSADKLLFGKGITQDDLIVKVSGNDIVVSFKNSTEDSITLKNWYTEDNRIEYFEFADGSRLDENGIIALMATDDVDTVKGTEKDNTLTGGASADLLEDNGQSYDTYLAGNGDTISDNDGSGRVNFENTMLSGGTFNKDTGVYEGDGGSYSLSGGTLTFTNGSGTITIDNYSKSANSLGIHLEDDEDDDILPETSAGEGHNENFSSPLVLDLNGNGTTSTFIAQTKTYFDMDGDGFRERTSWTESTDGLLTLDLNNDGKVTNGGELFGNNTKLANGTLAKDGFEALSQYDLNKDNIIDAKDSIYSHLKVWSDTNSDGISTEDELKTLQELNITSINLNATETSTSEAYNQISDSSTFTQNGQTKTINDVWFYQNKSDTTYDYTTPIKESVAALPTIEGSGRVKELRDAMNDDSVLEAKVTNLVNNASSMNFASFSTAFKDMVARWSGTDTISATATRGTQSVLNHNYANPSANYVKEIYAYARDVAILEAFAGKSFNMVVDGVTTSDVIGTEVSVAMDDAHQKLQYSQMIAFLSDAMYGSPLSKDELITKLHTTLSTTPNDTLSTLLLSTMVHRYGLDTLESFDDTLLLNTTFKTALSTNGISYSVNSTGEVVGSYGDVQKGSSGNDTISGSGYIYGGDGNDVLYGSSGKDVIDGGKGDDKIYGGQNNDLLRGGEGNDYIVAGTNESDSYYGHDILDGGIGNDILVGTSRNSTYVYRYGDGHDMIIDSGSFDGTGDNLRLENILLSDINVRQSGNDVIIDILDVSDTSVINGSITIKNGVGSGAIEKIALEDGTYILNAFLNTQVVNGQRVYKVEDNFGTVSLSSNLNNRRLLFGNGISVDDIIVQASSSSNDLVIALKEEGKSFSELSNKLTLTNWFNTNNRIESFVFSDGKILNDKDIVGLFGTEGDDYIRALDDQPLFTQCLNGNDIVNGSSGSDTIEAGAGDDTIYANAGADILDGGKGSDILQGGIGNDLYKYNKGDGKDSIYDASGTDTLSFGIGISSDDLIVKAVQGSNDLIIALKEEGKSFDELSDKITLSNWFNTDNRIESFIFSDGTILDTQNIISLQKTTQENDYVRSINTATMDGLGGNDVLEGSSGNETFIGNTGNDMLYGSAGNDTYIYNKGDGRDTIYDDSRYAPYSYYPSYTIQQNAGTDKLVFGEGISKENLVFKLNSSNNDLIIILKQDGVMDEASTDCIVIKEWKNGNNCIESIQFADGSVMDEVAIVDYATLFADGVNDTMIVTAESSLLNAKEGNDTYVFGRDVGKVSIYDNYTVSNIQANGGNDTLLFETGISLDDVWFKKSGNDLLVGIKEDGKSFDELGTAITLKNWYTQNNRIENFTFSDGTSYGEKDIYTLMLKDGAAYGTLGDDTIIGTTNNDTIYADAGNDVLNGEMGSDVLQGEAGNDTYVFNRGDGSDTVYDDSRYTPYYWNTTYTVQGNGGNDTLSFGEGITTDDIIVKASANSNDLIVALKEDGKSFDELTDKIVLKDWFSANNRIESFTFSDGTVLSTNDIVNLQGTEDADTVHLVDSTSDVTLSMKSGDDVVQTSGGNDTIDGGWGNDTIKSSMGNDTLLGNNGNDTLYADAGNDVLSGGKGVDNLQGGAGNDTYVFNRGDGSDTVYDDYRYTTGNYWWNQTVVQGDAGNDTLSFGEGISADDIIVQASINSNDLLIALKEEGKSFDELTDKIVLKDWFNANNRIETFTFNDGTILHVNDIVNLQGTEGGDTVHLVDSTSDVTLSMQSGDDVVQTSGGNDTIDGGWGNDTIKSGAGNDMLLGNDGDDTLYGEAGDDILNGGKGADNLQGGLGNDTYVFNRGDGSDTVYDDYRYTTGNYWWNQTVVQGDAGNDTLSFGEGITSDDIIVQASVNSNDLTVALKEEGKSFDELTDKIVLKDWFNANNRIETFRFNDETILHVNDIVNLQGTEDADTVHLVDSTSDVILSMQGGDDVVQTSGGNDTIDGGAGNDTLKGGAGDDTYLYAKNGGADTIIDTSGNDILSFGEGITTDAIIVQASATSNDLIIALKEDGKSFDELTDKIVLKDWFNANNRIETFTFRDGTTLHVNDIVALQPVTSGDDYLRYTEANDTIEGKEGNDTLVGGDGDDVYLFGRGDGQDTIIDIAKDNDSISFKSGISLDDIEVQVIGTQMMIALKEEGKSFEELSDKLILESVGSNDYGIEWLSFEDGSKIDPRSLIMQYNGTDNTDEIDLAYLQAINPNVTADTGVIIDAKEGYDTVTLGNGNNTITNAENITVGDGNNTIANAINITAGNGNNEIDLSTNLGSIWISAGEGNNQLNVNDLAVTSNSEGNSIKGYYGNGNNTFLFNSGDGDVRIESGDGHNTFIVSGDVDKISITLGDGNNTIDQDDTEDDDTGYFYGNEPFEVSTGDGDNEITLSGKAQDHQITVGDGDNTITVEKEPESYNYYRNNYGSQKTYIEAGDGDNVISVLSGDGSEQIGVGHGKNTIEFTSDLDAVSIITGNGNNKITQLNTEDSDNDKVMVVSSFSVASTMLTSSSASSSYGDRMEVTLGDGNNEISLSGKAQDHQIAVGDGSNIITVAKESESYNHNRVWDRTSIETGDGNNTISVQSGDGTERITVGDGSNNIEFTSDLDNVYITVGNGDNTITQLQYGDDDGDSREIAQIQSYYYGDEEENSTDSNNYTYINLGKGTNQVSLGNSNDSVYYYGGYETITGSNTIDVGAGNNTIALYSDTDQTIITGSNTFSENSGNSNIVLGNGNNNITVQNGQEASLNLGSGNNHVVVTESSLNDASFEGGNNTIEITNERLEGMTHSLTFNGGENSITVEGTGTLLSVNGSGDNTINLTDSNDALVVGINHYDEPHAYAKTIGMKSSNSNRIDTGAGNDMIASIGFSSDTYILNKGDGCDRLYDMSGYDSIVFGEGITASNISVSVLRETVGDTGVENYSDYLSTDMIPSSDTELISLVIRYGDNLEDQIILTDWYNTGRVESFNFSDGTVLSDHEIVSLIGSSESELVLGTEGENTLEAHSGDDIVGAREGNDTYVFGKGDGHDTFVETQGFDTISFKEGISKSDLILQSSGNDLVIFLKEAGKTYDELQDSIVIANWFDESGRIERLCFSDGTTMELDDIFGAIDASDYVFYGTPDVDEMNGSDAVEVIMALASNDVVNGNGGNDLLFGQEGDDTLDGGKGDDILYGGVGNDTYVISQHSGNDTIFDSAGIDKLLFTEGISVDDISIYFEGNDLLVNLKGTSLRLQGWYKADNRIESFSFSDGTTLGVNDILALMISDSDDYARTLEEGSTLETLEGNDTLLGGSGNNTLLGGVGNDMYRVSFKGNDVILDSSGVDMLSFDASISPTNLKMTWQQGTHDLILSSDQFPNSSVTLQGWYDQANRIETFTFSDGTVWNVADIIDHLGTDSADVYNGLQEEDNIINARGGDDIISTYAGNDTLDGGSGYDSLDAGSGNDILNGETGNDLLLGGAGDDMYLFEGNFGHDVIIDEADDHSNGGSADKIVFGKGIDASNLVFKTDLNDTNLYIGIKEGDTPFEKLSNTITITNWYDPKNRIETILFNDGTEVSIQQLVTAALSSSGEMIKAYEEGGILVGTPQKDYLVGGSGSDEIYGREDDDTILENVGDDILVGEAGNDVLNGGLGNDIYGFGYGDGADVIHDLATESQSNFAFVVGEDGISRWQAVTTEYSVDAGNDTLYFAEGISVNNLVVSNSGKDLIIQLKGTTDQVTIEGFYESDTRIENFAFSDGTILDATAIETLLYTQGNDTVVFEDNLNHIAMGLDGDDVITTSSGNDILEGGAGNDVLNGGLGDDVYVFGKGNGKDSIAEVGGSEWWQTNGGNDQILLTNGLTQDDIIVKKVGDAIVIGIKEEGKSFEELSDTITIKNAFSDAGSIEAITFEDGSSVLVDDVVIMNQAPILADTEVNVKLQDVRESTGTINATDPDGDTLIYGITTQTTHGTLSVDETGAWLYKANDGYIGNDSAIIKVDDGNGGVVEQTLNFTLSVSAPNIMTTNLNLDEDTSLTDLLNVTNPIGGALTYAILDATDHGNFVLNSDGTYSYTPLLNYNGLDSITLKVTNEYGLSSTQTIELNIAPINDAPTIESNELSYLLKNARTLSGSVLALDIDGDILTYGISTQSLHGKISINEKGEWTYKADGSYNGNDSAVIVVSDGNGGLVEQTLRFTIQGYIYEGENLVIDDTTGDTLDMSGISKDDLSFARNGANLVITVLNAQTITLKNYFTNIHAGVEKLVTAEGDIVLTRDVINESMYGGYSASDSKDHLISGDQYANWLIGNTGDDIVFGSGGNDYISGGSGNDLLIGGKGNDNLQGNSGNDTIYADDGNDQVYAGDGNDVLIGGNGSDILFGENGDDWISGGTGKDTLYGGYGNDTLAGSVGDDYLDGSYGSDTYRFNIGDGADTIVDASAYGSKDADKLVLGEGITQDNLQILRDNYDLIFKVNNTDSIRVKYWFASDQRNTLEQIVFSDGTTLSTNDVNALAMTLGSESNDCITGLNTFMDHLYGFGGNDNLSSYGGDDFLDGGKGNDRLYAGEGNDTLTGGTGNDYLEGAQGSDTYLFNKGDGTDTIFDYANCGSNDVDTIRFGDGVTQEDISFLMKNGNLSIQYSSSDTINVLYAQYSASSQIERMELSNGSFLTNNDMNHIIQQMSAYASEKGISLSSNDVIQNNQALMQIVSSSWHNA